MLLEEGVCYDQCVLLAELYQPLPRFILYSKAKFAYFVVAKVVDRLGSNEEGWLYFDSHLSNLWSTALSQNVCCV